MKLLTVLLAGLIEGVGIAANTAIITASVVLTLKLMGAL